jgi:predicted acylesterase/phospholipase RssA
LASDLRRRTLSPADDTDTAKPIGPVSVEKLAAAAQPGAEMDDGSRRLLDEELKTLKLRRRAQELEPPRDDQLTGIALSGGGIRSATFCLGVLQALAKENLLKRFDYLSTVSGGG